MSQSETEPTTTAAVIRSEEFRLGVADARAGRPPRYDDYECWNYEWGRQFGIAAPRNLSITEPSRYAEVIFIFDSIYFHLVTL